MQLIVTQAVYQLFTMTASQPAQRRFLCRVYLEEEGGEPSWALREASEEESGVKLEYGDVTLWCTKEDESLLDKHILLKDPKRGLISVPAVVFLG